MATTNNGNCFMMVRDTFTKHLKKMGPKMVKQNGVGLGALFLRIWQPHSQGLAHADDI
jgi:hypothetical protein